MIHRVGRSRENDGVPPYHANAPQRDAREAIFTRLKQHREVTLGVDRFANIVAKPPPVDPDKHPDHALTITLLRRQHEELDARQRELENQLPLERDQTQAVEKVFWKVQDERVNLEEENLLSQQKCTDVQFEVGELEHRLGEMEVRCKQAREARADLERQLQEIKAGSAKMQEQLEQRQRDWANEEKVLKSQAEQARAEADALQRKRGAGEEKLEVLRKELEAATRDANQTKAAGDRRIAELTAQHGDLKHDIASEVAEQEQVQKKLQLWRDRFEEDTRRHLNQRKSAQIKCQDARAQVANVRAASAGTSLPAIS